MQIEIGVRWRGAEAATRHQGLFQPIRKTIWGVPGVYLGIYQFKWFMIPGVYVTTMWEFISVGIKFENRKSLTVGHENQNP